MIRPDGTADTAILSTITDAGRVPGIGHQLTIHDVRLPCRTADAADHPHPASWMREPEARHPAEPERLTLWDQPAELWGE